jgi:hypothetical protein
MQRDVEIEIDTVDKSGGFIGSLYVNKTENAALALVREGLASVHGYSAEGLSWAKQLYDAEVCIWHKLFVPSALTSIQFEQAEAKKSHQGVCMV